MPDVPEPPSFLMLVNVWPIPEDDVIRVLFDRFVVVLDDELDELFEVDLSTVTASRMDVISLEDLDDLPEVS